MESIVIQPGIARPLASGSGLALWAQVCEKAGRYLLRVAAAHAAAQKNRRTVLELQRLDTRMLQDIGLTRADVDMLGASMPEDSLRGWQHYA